MPPQVDVNLEGTPDELKPIEAGIYMAKVGAIETELKDTKAGGQGTMITIPLKISGDATGQPCEASEHQRGVIARCCVWTEPGKVQWKRFLKSCGMPISNQVDTEECMGKTCKVQVGVRKVIQDSEGNYVNKEGEGTTTRLSNEVQDFVIPEK